MKYFNKKVGLLLLTCLLFTLSAKLTLTSLTAKHSNQGYNTDYIFSFSTAYTYKWAHARIDFPIEYSLSSFQMALDCWISNSSKAINYRPTPCWI